jgi:hypothetical protein
MNDEDWVREVKEAGSKLLCIIDVYDESWGPCEMIAGHLSNFYFDMGEQYGIKFVRAQANKVPDLAEFKETAVPHFLVYLDGQQLERIDGANIPKIKSCIVTKAPSNKG